MRCDDTLLWLIHMSSQHVIIQEKFSLSHITMYVATTLLSIKLELHHVLSMGFQKFHMHIT